MNKYYFISILLTIMFTGSLGIAVMSVDLGSEWLKIGIVKPGVPMEIALNKESRRKTPFTVSMRGDERLFGDPAMNVAVRQPPKAFIYLSHLLGKKFDSPSVQLFQKRFPFYKLLKDEERGTVIFEGEENQNYSVEELVAMVLNSSKHIAENFANHKMKDVVLTVPAFFRQAERKALILAANMSGLNVLQLINDNTAVALNYGIFRAATFNSSVKHIMFYDMGASHTTATIVGYSTTKVKDRGYVETVPQLAVKGVGFDATLGGLEMDMRLRDYLVKGFKEKYSNLKSDISKNHRSMAKMLKEAKRVRQVLSANVDHFAQIENVFEEKDFKMKVTRVVFEELCSDLFERVGNPIKMAFDASALTKDDIETVILMGGGSRIPRVQEILSKIVGKEELGKSINTDEAAALGAVYKAASLMAGFKVKRFIVKDLNIFPVDIQFERTSKDDPSRKIDRNLYHRLNIVPQKKIMTFNRKLSDFNFNISYGDLTFLSSEMKNSLNLQSENVQIGHVKLSGIDDAHNKNLKGTSKGVKAFFLMDDSGILNIEKVEAHFEKTPEVIEEEESTLSKIGSKISSLFGSLKKEEPTDKVVEETDDSNSGDKKASEGDNADKPKDDQSEQSSSGDKGELPKPDNSTNSTILNATQKVENKTEKAKPKNVVIVEQITYDIENLDLADMSSDKFEESVKKLKALEARDQAKQAVEKARNVLESFISENREKLEQEELQQFSTGEEREKIENSLTEVYNWYDEDGFDADEETLKKKLKSLKEITKELNLRLKEAHDRPKAIAEILQSLNLSTVFYETMMSMPDAIEIYTEKDRKDLEKVLLETKEWFMTTWKKQNETDLSKKPVLLVKDIVFRQGKLDREMMYLINKAKYYVPKPKPKNETKASSTKTDGESVISNTTDEVRNKTSKSTDKRKTADSSDSAGEKKIEDSPKPTSEKKLDSSQPLEENKTDSKGTEDLKENDELEQLEQSVDKPSDDDSQNLNIGKEKTHQPEEL